MLGLDLLRLLVQNRIAEFHTELELLAPEVGPLCGCVTRSQRRMFVLWSNCIQEIVRSHPPPRCPARTRAACNAAGACAHGLTMLPHFLPACAPSHPTQVQESPYIRHAVQLEQWLMEGAYNKVLDAAKGAQLPSEFHAPLMQQLSSTVRWVGGRSAGMNIGRTCNKCHMLSAPGQPSCV